MDALAPDFPNKLHHSTTLPYPHDTQTAICVVYSEIAQGKHFGFPMIIFLKPGIARKGHFISRTHRNLLTFQIFLFVCEDRHLCGMWRGNFGFIY